MSKITSAFQWIEERLEKGAWVRRAYLFLAMWMNTKTLLWALDFASASPRPGLEVVAIVGAVAAIPGAAMVHAFKLYLASRG